MIEEKYSQEYVGFREDPFFNVMIRRVLTTYIRSRIRPPAAVLDVGCGAGEFMKAASEAGYDIEGMDVSESAVAICRSRGLQARTGDFPRSHFDRSYDLITMWDVLEHVRDPVLFLRKAHELLAPGGHLILKIPGFGRFSFLVVRAYNRMAGGVLGAPGHVQYFSESSLAAALGRCNFSSVAWLPPQQFRSRPPTRSVKKKLARTVYRSVAKLSGNKNLFVIATK